MNSSKRDWIRVVFAGALSVAVSGTSWALNPQPEVPSKPRPDARANPKALNPQPEVPSKPVNALSPKALNPQPEVPSKPKKTVHKKKSKPLLERK
jgi:hypothetical protein